MLEINEVDKADAKMMVEECHYSGKCPGIKYCHGLFEDGKMVGVVVYSQPASYTLCEGVCGKDYKKQVVELARLVIDTPADNAASFLVGRSLRALPNHVVVSYADCNDHVGHIGYVYQATNWIYTGLSSAEPTYVLEADHPSGLKAGTVISYTRRHIDVKARELGFNWGHNASSGPGISRRKTKGKHRYVYFTGDRRFVKVATKHLRYPILPYPKGQTRRHYCVALRVGGK